MSDLEARVARLEAIVIGAPEAPSLIEEVQADVGLAAWLKVCEDLVASNPTEHPDIATASENFVNLLHNEGII